MATHYGPDSEIHRYQSSCRTEGTRNYFYLTLKKKSTDWPEAWYNKYPIGDVLRGCCLRQQKTDSNYYSLFFDGWKTIYLDDFEVTKVELWRFGEIRHTKHRLSVQQLIDAKFFD